MRGRQRRRPARTILVTVAVAAVGTALAVAVVHWLSASRPAATPQEPTEVFESGKSRGRPDAPVVIEVFSDFLCGHCADFALKIEPGLIREFVAPGVVRLVHRDFPIVAPLSSYLAAAGECAADQQRFWAFYEAVFKRTARRAWREARDMDATVREAGMDPATIAACAQRQAVRDRVERDFDEGTRRGVQGTPTLFIGGRMIVGAQPLDVLRVEINAARPK